jgi:hypothetical protein
MRASQKSPDFYAEYFVGYLFRNYGHSYHVRRIASWIGFIVKAVEGVVGSSFSRHRSRQLVFDYKSRHFKVRYHHGAGTRGGVDIVEVLPGRGTPDGGVVVSMANLSDAEDVYKSLRKRLDRFVKGAAV